MQILHRNNDAYMILFLGSMLAVAAARSTLRKHTPMLTPDLLLPAYVLPTDYEQMTWSGCQCTSFCTATSKTGPDDDYQCGWCHTDAGCGYEQAGARNWDFCDYSEVHSYEQQRAETKLQLLWSDISNNTSSAEPYAPSAVLNVSMVTVVANQRDVLPAEYKKVRHSVGSVCKVSLNITDSSPYTGIFDKGIHEHGLLRMSSQGKLDPTQGFIPGLGIKFMRDGVISADTVALHKEDHYFWNFFQANYSNHVPGKPPTSPTAEKISTASQCTGQVGLSDMARYKQDGTRIADSEIHFPFKLMFVPLLQLPNTPKTQLSQIFDDLAGIEPGTQLMEVWACGRPAGNHGAGELLAPTSVPSSCGDPLLLGQLVAASKCTTSYFGDTRLAVRHQRIEQDWELKPGILKEYDAEMACGASRKLVSNKFGLWTWKDKLPMCGAQ